MAESECECRWRVIDPFAGTEDLAEEYKALENAMREQELIGDSISFKNVATKVVQIFQAQTVHVLKRNFKAKKLVQRNASI